MRKNIVITGVYGDQNIGDAAILEAALECISEAVKERTDVVMLCSDPKFLCIPHYNKLKIRTLQMPYGYAIRSHGRPVGSLVRAKRLVEIWMKSYLFSYSPPTDGFYSYIRALKLADAVIGVGGGYLRTKDTYRDYFGVLLTILPHYIAQWYGKRFLFLPTSFGNYASSVHEKITGHSLRNSNIMVRDSISLKKINRYKHDYNLHTSLHPDLAFFANSDYTTTIQRKRTSEYMVLTAREWMSEKKQQAYERSLVRMIEFAWKSHALRTIFIPMTWNEIEDNDNRVARRLQKEVRSKKSFAVKRVYSPAEVSNLLKGARMAICTRMHSSILAATVLTPFICLAYEHKTIGMLQMLRLSEWNINIDEVTYPRLKRKYLKLMNDSVYENFINSLQKSKASLRERKKHIVDHIKDCIYLS